MGEVMCMVSKTAQTLVKNGLAEYIKGGVRDIKTGKIIELFKPVLTSVSGGVPNIVVNGVKAVSSLAGNVQCAFIQKGVNTANVKLDTLIAKFERLEHSFNLIPGLEVANLAVGLVNCAITTGGLYIINENLTALNSQINEKLTALDSQIKAIYNIIDYDNSSNILEKFDVLSARAARYLQYLESGYYYNNFADVEKEISSFLEDTYSFLNRRMREAEAHRFNEEFIFALVGKLSVCFAKILKEYTVHYRFAPKSGGEYPPNFDKYMDMLLEISGNAELNSIIKNYILLNNAKQSLPERKTIYLTTKNIIPYEIENINAVNKAVELIGGDSIDDFNSRLTSRVMENSAEMYWQDEFGNVYVDLS